MNLSHIQSISQHIRRLFLPMFTRYVAPRGKATFRNFSRSRFASQVLRRGEAPPWSIERSSRRWGAVPPL
jgi:hypothetical protein